MRARYLFIAALLLGVGCSAGTTNETSTTTASPSSAAAVTVARDVPYATVRYAEWIPALLDVYAPKGAHGLPLVVMFHGGGNTKASFLPPVANAVAREGAVVVAANWGNVTPSPPAASAIVLGTRVASEAACAVSFAVAHARDYGADPSRLVLFGHSAGANTAAMVAYGKPKAFPGCRVTPSVWTPRGVMLWEGDWLLETGEIWDKFGAAIATVMPAYTPWRLLAAAPKIAARLAVADMSRVGLDRCSAKGSAWLAWRDVTGTLRHRLASSGALNDDCVNVGEAAELLAASMRGHGIEAKVLVLPDPGSIHEILAPADLGVLARNTVALASG